jgi:ornithine cyclodeaminase
VELGDVITKKAAGRKAAGDITIADLTGTGAQDTAIASHVAAKLAGGDAGTVIKS